MQAILTQEIGYFTLLYFTWRWDNYGDNSNVLVKAETKWLGTKKTFEWFSTAGRNVK
jgi:urea-proton symporter